MIRPFYRLGGRLILALCLATGMLHQAAAQGLVPEPIRVTPGDAINLYIYENLFPAEKGKFVGNYHDKEYLIDGTGHISLGPLGRVLIAGLKAEEIAQVLQEKLRPYAKDPFIIVMPLIRLELKGGFSAPGMYRFNPGMSFWEMIKQAGGLTSLASFEDMYIMRKGEPLYQNFGEAFYRGQSLQELGLISGDEIYAPRVTRLSFESIMRYISFAMSIFVFYFTLVNYNTKKE